MQRSPFSRLFAFLSTLALCAGLASCGSSTKESDGAAKKSGGKLNVATSFYPVQWLVQQIGGDKVTATSVTPANVEPHDYEISPAQIAKLGKVDALVYVKGFQPSLDEAAEALKGPKIVDLSGSVDLVHHEGVESEHHEHKDGEGHAHKHAHKSGSEDLDPHFWLDPVRMGKAADRVTERLAKADPSSAETFKANAKKLKERLGALNGSYDNGVKTCQRRAIVTTHTAFGYMAERYKLTQIALSGIDPEAEPSPAVLAQVKKFIQENGTTTVFTEELLPTKTAEALAKETGIKTDVLNPLESKPDDGDYISVMDKNLKAIRTALGCS